MIRRILFVLGIVAAASVFGSRAEAGCHAFTFADNTPTSVDEGSKVNITIERDNTFAPSSVRVRTINNTATAPSDYNVLDQRVQFTGEEVEKTVTITTREDSTDEPGETFRITLSEGQGCEVNPNFTYDSPHSMTIKDDDPPASTTAPTVRPQQTPRFTIIPARTTTPVPTESATPSPKPTKSGEPTLPPTPSGTPPFAGPPVEEESGFPWLPVLGAVGLLAAAGGALILTRMRSGGV